MTEDEAKTKWCPFARTVTLQTETAYGITQPAGPVANRWIAGPHTSGQKPTERISLCIGSNCMAWRSDGGHWTSPLGPEAVDKALRPEDVDARWVFSGYCGLAGKLA